MWNWIRVSSLLLVIAACEFPRPADVEPGSCKLDDDCGGSTPYCAGGTCGACAVSDTCPAGRPVCDEVSHDCRTCAKDSECDSGACDIAAGTCVEQGAILYASPAGGYADDCTHSNPCSLGKAAQVVDTDHSYIVLLPGTHTTGAYFNSKNATICGNNATIDTNIAARDSSSVTIRDVRLSSGPSLETQEPILFIQYDNSKLTLDNVDLVINTSKFAQAIAGQDQNDSTPATLTIRNSTFRHGGMSLVGDVSIDRSKFFLDTGISFDFARTGRSIGISNSIIVTPPENIAIDANPDSTTYQASIGISNNTIIGGTISCGGAATTKFFRNNILYNINGIQDNEACWYYYNMIVPSSFARGQGNFSLDPQFVDLANGDFHLKPGSPAIDAADPSIPADTGYDLAGIFRPQGVRFDLGAYEYVP